MKIDVILVRRGGEWTARFPGGGERKLVVTVAQASRMLRLGRRQVYRLVADGSLPRIAKVFGELLFDSEAVNRLALAPRVPQRLPARLGPLLPEYDLAKLNLGRDRSLIISRVLDRGIDADVRWLLRRLPRKEIASAVERDGARLLSERSLRRWSLYFKVTPKPLPDWRSASPWLDARS